MIMYITNVHNSVRTKNLDIKQLAFWGKNKILRTRLNGGENKLEETQAPTAIY